MVTFKVAEPAGAMSPNDAGNVGLVITGVHAAPYV